MFNGLKIQKIVMEIEKNRIHEILCPRPIAVITTLNSFRAINACVVSFISPISFEPAIVMIALAPIRHTYKNIKETKEFVVNILGKEFIDQTLMCAKKYQEGVNKVQQAGLRWYSSKLVKPPRIKEAKAWIECKFLEDKKVGDHVVIFGEVLEVEVAESILTNGEIDLTKLNPIAHISKDKFAVDFKIIKHKRYD